MLCATVALTLASGVVSIDPTAVRPGQTGTCVTEWTGGQRREIPVQVLGVMDAAGPERRSILVRLTDPELAGGGVVAGMSGSPVYIDGRLLGAVAYGWAFAREPLAGVTPFQLMERVIASGSAAPAPPPTLGQLAALMDGTLGPLEVAPRLPEGVRRAPHTLAVAGLAPADAFGQELLHRAALETVPSAGRTEEGGVPEPGEMMAILLAWGDGVIAAGGTVTARDGDRVFALGHPLFALGRTSYPAAQARVLAVQGSYQAPFKLFAIGASFGTVVADRSAGILAEVGPPPEGLPVTIRLGDATGQDEWHFRVVDSPLLAPLMVTYLTNASLTARGASTGEASVRLRLTATLADGRRVEVAQAVRGLDALARVAAFTGGLSAALMASPVPHPRLAGLLVQLERAERLDGATVAEVLPSRTQVRPGDTLDVAVRLQPHLGERVERRLSIRVPEVLPPGPLDLIVADGAAWSEYRMRIEPVLPVTHDDLLQQIAMLESSTTLVAALESRETGVAVPGEPMPALPPSWSATLSTGLGRALPRLSTAVLATSRWTAPYPLEGAARLSLTVRPRLESK